MRDYDPERDNWTHEVRPRSWSGDRMARDPDLCRNGRDHEFASGECVVCEAPDPYEDRPSRIHPYDDRDDHICFAGCRHSLTPEGRYIRQSPNWEWE